MPIDHVLCEASCLSAFVFVFSSSFDLCRWRRVARLQPQHPLDSAHQMRLEFWVRPDILTMPQRRREGASLLHLLAPSQRIILPLLHLLRLKIALVGIDAQEHVNLIPREGISAEL